MEETTIKQAIRLAIDNFIKPFEGYEKRLPDGRCTSYPDPGTGGHPWTIGYGTTGPDIVPGLIWTHEQAELALINHVIYFTTGVLELSPGLVEEPPRRLAAIISFAYNCGLGNYRISTLRKRVNEKEWDDAAREIVKWNKAAGRVLRGLTKRRQAEASFLL